MRGQTSQFLPKTFIYSHGLAISNSTLLFWIFDMVFVFPKRFKVAGKVGEKSNWLGCDHGEQWGSGFPFPFWPLGSHLRHRDQLLDSFTFNFIQWKRRNGINWPITGLEILFLLISANCSGIEATLRVLSHADETFRSVLQRIKEWMCFISNHQTVILLF